MRLTYPWSRTSRPAISPTRKHPLIFYIRHGQTDWNAERRFQGRIDIPLNDTGRRQAAANGRKLFELVGSKPDKFHFIASPLQRTRETMEIILANLGVSSVGYQADERLVEAAYGEWEGRTLHEIQQEDPAAYFAREADRWGYAAPGGESAAMALERVRPLLDSLAGPTIIVGHGAVGRAVRQHLLNLDVAEAGAFDFPQDRIFKFENGIEQVICGRQNGR